jgi:hypothetical protein
LPAVLRLCAGRGTGFEYPEDGYLLIQPDVWKYRILPQIRNIPNTVIVSATGLIRRQVVRLKQGKHRPQKETIEKLLKCFILFQYD